MLFVISIASSVDPEHQLRCKVCSSVDLDGQLYRWFGVCVCVACRKAHEDRFGLCTKTEAREDFLLTNSDIASLPHVARPNPHNANWRDMHLYLLEHVHELAMKKHGGEEGLEKAFDGKRQVKQRKRTHQLNTQLNGTHAGKRKKWADMVQS